MNRQRIVDREDLSKVLASMNKEEIIDLTKKIFSDVLSHAKEKTGIKEDKIYKLIEKEISGKAVEIPISIFNNGELSALEAIVKYMKENMKLKYSQIGVLLNRDERNIWTTYNNSKKKRKKKFSIKKKDYAIPASIFKNRKLSVLENITKYLKENKKLTYHNIAELLNRNDRTIWTVYNRAQTKKAVSG